MRDIRQSENWCTYQKLWGWESFKTQTDINILIKADFLGTFAKVQRPRRLTKQDLTDIDALCKSKKCTFIKIEPPQDQNLKILENFGYVESDSPLAPPATLVIDLTKSTDALWKDISSSGKYAVNRAKREGNTIEVYQNPTPEITKTFRKVLEDSANYNSAVVYPLNTFMRKVEIFRNDIFIFIARDAKGQICGATMYDAYDGSIWYMHGGTTLFGRANKAGYLLHWEAIVHFKNLGYSYLDLEGVYDERFHKQTKNWTGFSLFKKKFGGEIVVFPKPHVKIFSPTLRGMVKLTHTKL